MAGISALCMISALIDALNVLGNTSFVPRVQRIRSNTVPDEGRQAWVSAYLRSLSREKRPRMRGNFDHRQGRLGECSV